MRPSVGKLAVFAPTITFLTKVSKNANCLDAIPGKEMSKIFSCIPTDSVNMLEMIASFFSIDRLMIMERHGI